MKLSQQHLADLPASMISPTYDRLVCRAGILHIGVGGFHRAHQAIYTEALLNQGLALHWGICGAGVRESDRAMKEALESQDYLYTLIELGAGNEVKTQVVGVITEFILAQDSVDAFIQRLSDPDIRIVSLTVTEGGYFTDDTTGKFKDQDPDILADLAQPDAPKTLVGLLCQGLKRRMQAGIPPFTVMSCDNLPHNGDVARKAVLGYASLLDTQLMNWIADNVTFPNGMVDRITPMTSQAHKQQLFDSTEVEDVWPVVAEPFLQWVVEDKFCNGRPEWEVVGVQFTQDVTPYETMKIGLLNGSHLAMTFLGTLLGYEFAHQTMEDEDLRRFVENYMDHDVTPLLAEVPGINLTEYKQTLIERFSNPAICDQLTRICSDAAAKFPKFVFPTLRGLIAENKPLERVALIVAAWTHYLHGKNELGQTYPILDPKLAILQRAIAQPETCVTQMLEIYDIFGDDLPSSNAFVEAYQTQLSRLQTQGVRATLKQLIG
ncbi:mannitol dehydrogenase family protein [Nitrincola nitratireducens]|uniref:Polyol:NADP oxidoreductase n=1 Tax=Nitrincola nitratireducens TaxID=1229521 RepID=W9V7X0_9GAMM|nr:mannitol dehydrogenase family protein [Nitrincola nitratireducens]EXJ12976.1 Polyol:NADP oxidoreductase [Nitrincola nitratireducens]